MQTLLPYITGALAIWAVVRVWQVRELAVRYAEVRRNHIEQDRPVKG